MGPVIANLEGIILARQFAQTMVNNKPIANYTNQELLNILDDDNNELSRNQILTIARFLQLQGDR
jgi:hypothetical protein